MNADSTTRMLGESTAFLEVQEQVSKVAPLSKPLLVVGERGTGKELIASRIHFLSERWGQPFLKINCAAISDTLLDSQLFGHEAGAFSGATKQHKGYFERTDGGTLFLDELATTSVAVQEKILRVIEYGELTRLGGDKVVDVDVRLVAATNGDLPAMAERGDFRADLLDRLAFDVITLPPLRSRQEDIEILAEAFAMGMIKEMRRDYFPGFSARARQQMMEYAWPGNIRELKNVVERAVYRSVDPDEPIHQLVFDPFASPYRPVEDVKPASVSKLEPVVEPVVAMAGGEASLLASDFACFQTAGQGFKQFCQDREVGLLRDAMAHCHFNQRKTAEYLGLTYHQLRGYLRKYDLLDG